MKGRNLHRTQSSKKEWRADPRPREGNNEDLPPVREENPPREDGPDQKIMEEWREWKEWGEWNVAPLSQQREEEESTGGVGTWARTDSPATATTTQQ